MAYKFIKTIDKNNPYDIAEVTMEVGHNDIALKDLLEVISDFLRASGFQIESNSIEVVEDDQGEEE